MKIFHQFFTNLLILLIRGYQRVRVFLDTICMSVFGFSFTCKHTPNCSEYMIGQIKERGTIQGSFHGVVRILKCW